MQIFKYLCIGMFTIVMYYIYLCLITSVSWINCEYSYFMVVDHFVELHKFITTDVE